MFHHKAQEAHEDFMLHFVTNDEFTICHNRMGFPQEIGTQHDK